MRTTQYIGLNDYAKNLVKDAIRVEVNPKMTFGMFEEDVPGKIYFCKDIRNPDLEIRYEEVEQASPWSSGPMIFTCLKGTFVNVAGQTIDLGMHCQWMLDPTVKGEYDEKTGRYYV